MHQSSGTTAHRRYRISIPRQLARRLSRSPSTAVPLGPVRSALSCHQGLPVSHRPRSSPLGTSARLLILKSSRGRCSPRAVRFGAAVAVPTGGRGTARRGVGRHGWCPSGLESVAAPPSNGPHRRARPQRGGVRRERQVRQQRQQQRVRRDEWRYLRVSGVWSDRDWSDAVRLRRTEAFCGDSSALKCGKGG